jgi:major membrane immunogen (membrane-anchored lipoprotein)
MRRGSFRDGADHLVHVANPGAVMYVRSSTRSSSHQNVTVRALLPARQPDEADRSRKIARWYHSGTMAVWQ